MRDCGQEPDLLRFLTAGSVDDGKSTLIGRLLFDANALFEDQIESLRKRSVTGEIDFSLVTDGLGAEREQGITIDVAYRYFSTSRRRFIIADSPGHEQYTRNMATAASNSDLAVLIIDARQGAVTQSKRHTFICSLFGIPRMVIAVNKMDLIGFDEIKFKKIVKLYEEFAQRLGLINLTFIPISAISGDNVVSKSKYMPWYEGVPLLTFLEDVYVAGDRNLVDFRFPVQRVIRAGTDFRGYAGRIPSGVVRVGDEVLALPSGFRTKVESIETFEKKINYAGAGQSITLGLKDDIDLARGDILVHPGNAPREYREIEAMIVWMGEEELCSGKIYWIKHATRWLKAHCVRIHYKVDPNTIRQEKSESLKINDIGRVRFSLFSPLFADVFSRNRHMGSFIVVSTVTNDTLAAATIIDRMDYDSEINEERKVNKKKNIVWHVGQILPEQRSQFFKHRPVTIWLTGLSGSGKSTIGFAVEKHLLESGHGAYMLDGDNIRHGLNKDLGFSPKDRTENIRRIAEVARLMNDAGLIVISAFISPYREDRDMAREIIGTDSFLEVFVNTPIQVCESRDPKGFYKKARAGELSGFTGISAPYEAPIDPALMLNTETEEISHCVEKISNILKKYLK